MSKTAKAVGISLIGLTLIYVLLCRLAINGYGYMGYYGYHRGPSLWHWGGPPIYHEPSNRSGSVSGTGRIGGGPGAGK